MQSQAAIPATANPTMRIEEDRVTYRLTNSVDHLYHCLLPGKPMKIFSAFILLLFLFGFGIEAVSASVPARDHHTAGSLLVEQIDGPISPSDEDNSDHGRHALHGCGVCHHAIGFIVSIACPYHKLTVVRFRSPERQMASSFPEPLYIPPIEVSA